MTALVIYFAAPDPAAVVWNTSSAQKHTNKVIVSNSLQFHINR